MASYRLPLAVVALVAAAISIALSAVLISGANGSIYMLQLDTTGLFDSINAYSFTSMSLVGLGSPSLQVVFPNSTLQSVFYTDSANNGSVLVERYLRGAALQDLPLSPDTLWDPRRSNDTPGNGTGNGTFVAFGLYAVGKDPSTGDTLEPTYNQTTKASQIGTDISVDANAWAIRDRSTFDAASQFRLRIAGLGLLGLGFLGLIGVAAKRGALPGLFLGVVATALGLSAICLLVSAAILTKGLVALQGTFFPFPEINPSPNVTYNISPVFLALTWASATTALIATVLAAIVAAVPNPKADAPLFTQAEMDGDGEPTRMSTFFGHQSITQPYNASANADERAKAHASVEYAPSAVGSDESPSPRDDHHLGKNTNRYSEVSSLGPSPVRTHF